MAAKITIRNKAGTFITDAFDYTYSGTFLGERKVSVEVQSATPINFTVGDYIIFGEYETNPSRQSEELVLQTIPVANRVHNSLMISYSLVFWWRGYELKTINFLDYVEGAVLDKQYNRNTGEVDLFGTIVQLMDRIVANMTRAYNDGWYGTWNYILYDVDPTEAKQITVQNVKCWDALLLVNSLFEYEFRIEYDTRYILVGKSDTLPIPDSPSHVFEFGKDDGLCEITRLHSEESLVTRVYAYGSTRNIPTDYRVSQYNHGYMPRLMLPAATYPDGYIANAALEAIYGIREDFLIDETIYPTIVDGEIDEVLTILDAPLPSEIVSANPSKYVLLDPTTSFFEDDIGDIVYVPDVAYYDDPFEIKYSLPTSPISGNGGNYDEVTVYIVTDIDINDENIKSTVPAKMSFTTGYLQGVELQINSWTKEITSGVATGRFKAVLQRNSNDDNYQLPNANVPIVAGDDFVLLDIFLPDAYVEAAEDRLATVASEYITNNALTPLAYSITVPEEFVAESSGIVDYLREGAALPITDTILGLVEQSYLIQTVSIDYKSELYLPTFNLTLSNKPLKNRIAAVEDQLKSAVQSIGAAKITSQYAAANTQKTISVADDKITNDYGQLKGAIIEPQSITVNSLAADLRADRYLLQAYLQANYNGDINSVLCSDGYLIHKDIDIVWGQVFDVAHQTWTIAAPQSFVLESAKYYWAYIKCNILDGVGVWYLSETKVLANEVEGFYMFEWGQIMAVVNGKRIVQNPAGSTGAVQYPIREVPTGVADGVNKIFTLSSTPAFNTDEVYINGQLRYPALAYELVGNTITFVDAPWVGAYLLAKYFI